MLDLDAFARAKLAEAREALAAMKEREIAMIRDCVETKSAMPANYWNERHIQFERVRAWERLLGE